MAKIKKANRYIVYLMALSVAGLFAFFKKPAPTWAKEAKQERSAKIFTEEFYGFNSDPIGKSDNILLAQAGAAGTTSTAERAFTVPGSSREFTAPAGERRFTAPAEITGNITSTGRQFTAPADWLYEPSEATYTYLNDQYSRVIQEIQTKVERGEDLSAAELAIILGNFNYRDILVLCSK